MKIEYIPRRFSANSESLIVRANSIIAEYAEQGFDLTLRQLYYQFVARDVIPNSLSEYKKLGSVINDARLAGRIDWDAIEDRTRNLQENTHWNSPAEIIEACATQYEIDKWRNQDYYIEVWIEKDALVGIVESVCAKLDVAYFSCRGYTSQSEMWSAAMRLVGKARHSKCIIIHLGDHDPSGKDMTRDIAERIRLFMEHHDTEPAIIRRIALNMAQIKKYEPPPNPAKITDSRAKAYIKEFGAQSWELDALDPLVLSNLIESEVLTFRDSTTWIENLGIEQQHKDSLRKIANTL